MKKYMFLLTIALAAAGCEEDEEQSPVCSCSSTYSRYYDTTSIPSTFLVPTAFTPNGDGVNDIFHVYGVGIDQFSMVILDGTDTVSSSNSVLTGWDGTINGNPPPACQTFDYFIDVTFANGETKHFENTVTAIGDTLPCPGNNSSCFFGNQYDATLADFNLLFPRNDFDWCY